jgi:predicted CoA-binding protein
MSNVPNEMSSVMDALIKPRTIAVIGASSRRSNNGNVVLTNLRDAGFNGKVIPVHLLPAPTSRWCRCRHPACRM